MMDLLDVFFFRVYWEILPRGRGPRQLAMRSHLLANLNSSNLPAETESAEKGGTMKRCIMITILAMAVVAMTAGIPGAKETVLTEADGRFVLFNAEYNSAIIQRSQTTTFLEKRLFKIDRRTGEAWMLIDAIREGKDIKYWKKIENERTDN